MNDYEIYTEEEIDIEDAIDTLESLYTRVIDEHGYIYFRADLRE